MGLDTAASTLDLGRGSFLHAGPPITWHEASGPLRGALIGAALLEFPDESPESVAARFQAEQFSLEPCHHRGAVGPMAGVISQSMPVFVVQDDVSGREAYCTLNEGLGKVLRYGAYSKKVLDRLDWIERVLAPAISGALADTGPIDMFAMIGEALQMGDEGHNRNRAGTSLLLRSLAPSLFESAESTSVAAECFRFMAGNDHFFLNLTMPASKVAADAARDIPNSTLVIAMARNGTEFGIQLAGTGDRWFTGPSGMPKGLLFAGYSEDDANPDIGDSTITETVGLGGFAMAAAPAIVTFVGGSAELALRSSLSMYEITMGEHPIFRLAALDYRGAPVGIDAALVCRSGLVPVVNTGIAGKAAGVGQVGAGLVEPPMSAFAAAIEYFGTPSDGRESRV